MHQPVLFRSTRNPEKLVTFRRALLRGLADDGGLYVPDHVPDIPATMWTRAISMAETGRGVLWTWLKDEFPHDQFDSIMGDALDFEVPLVRLNGAAWKDVWVLELFHGPTLSFKDVGARSMARLMAASLDRDDSDRVILVATSGDTGSAVADGFSGQERMRVILLYPKGQVSSIQEHQLCSVRNNVVAYAINGTFDDCQRIVKEAFLDEELQAFNLTSANSINIGRLLPQMLYYFWARSQGGFDEAVFSVPSGNLGNLTGGMLAMQSGLNVTRFIAGLNANNTFQRFLSGGTLEEKNSVRTLSNAMDVGIPSNLERLRSISSFKNLRNRIWPTSVSDPQTLECMQRVYSDTGYLADPHTAVGLEAARRYRQETEDRRPIVALATAHPAKFTETVEGALGIRPEMPERLEKLVNSARQPRSLSPNLQALKKAMNGENWQLDTYCN